MTYDTEGAPTKVPQEEEQICEEQICDSTCPKGQCREANPPPPSQALHEGRSKGEIQEDRAERSPKEKQEEQGEDSGREQENAGAEQRTEEQQDAQSAAPASPITPSEEEPSNKRANRVSEGKRSSSVTITSSVRRSKCYERLERCLQCPSRRIEEPQGKRMALEAEEQMMLWGQAKQLHICRDNRSVGVARALDWSPDPLCCCCAQSGVAARTGSPPPLPPPHHPLPVGCCCCCPPCNGAPATSLPRTDARCICSGYSCCCNCLRQQQQQQPRRQEQDLQQQLLQIQQELQRHLEQQVSAASAQRQPMLLVLQIPVLLQPTTNGSGAPLIATQQGCHCCQSSQSTLSRTSPPPPQAQSLCCCGLLLPQPCSPTCHSFGAAQVATSQKDVGSSQAAACPEPLCALRQETPRRPLCAERRCFLRPFIHDDALRAAAGPSNSAHE